MTLSEDDIKVINDMITNAIAPITTRLDIIEDELYNEINIIKALLHNSMCSSSENLVKVPLKNGALPLNEYPQTISLLAVPHQSNSVTAEKALALIREYEPDYTDDESDQVLTRKRRVRLAKLLGISATQLNFAQFF